MKRRVLISLCLVAMVICAGNVWAGNEGPPNVFYGNGAGASEVTGGQNVFIGVNAGTTDNGGNSNTFIGDSAGYNNTTGFYNTFVGSQAGSFNQLGYSNTLIGYSAGINLDDGLMNTMVGKDAGYFSATTYSNTFLGSTTGYYNTTGSWNTFVGTNAGHFNVDGRYNTFLGLGSGYKNTNGDYNTALGVAAGNDNETGDRNVFLGSYAGYYETGSYKLYIDSSSTTTPLIYGEFDNDIVRINGKLGVGKTPSTALDVSGTVTATSFVGSGSGLTGIVTSESDPQVDTLTNGKWCTSNGTAISCTTDAPLTAEVDPKVGSNTTNYIPKWNGTALVSGLIADDGSTVSVNGTLTATTSVTVSDERWKKNIEPLSSALAKVMHLQGVSYDWKADEYPDRGFTKDRQIGLIAQEVEKVIPELVYTDSNGYKAISYEKIVPVLIEAMKGDIKEKDARIAKLEKALEVMEKRLASLESPVKTLASK